MCIIYQDILLLQNILFPQDVEKLKQNIIFSLGYIRVKIELKGGDFFRFFFIIKVVFVLQFDQRYIRYSSQNRGSCDP